MRIILDTQKKKSDIDLVKRSYEKIYWAQRVVSDTNIIDTTLSESYSKI